MKLPKEALAVLNQAKAVDSSWAKIYYFEG
jgi:hypothetical protein